MAISSKRTYATCLASQVCCSQNPCPYDRPLLTHASTGDIHTLKGRSGLFSVGSQGPEAHKDLFEPSECLWQVGGLILHVILPLLPSCWGFSFDPGHITRWSIPKSDWLYSLQPKMEKVYTVNKNKTWSWPWLRSRTIYWKEITLKLKKVEKTTRPFRSDLNQIPYDCTVEVTKRFKGLDLINREPEVLWMEVHDIVHDVVIKTVPKEKKCKKAEWLSEEVLQIAEKKRSERQRRKGKIYPSECRVPKNSKGR